jgi:hypothetical protein
MMLNINGKQVESTVKTAVMKLMLTDHLLI